MEPKFPTRIGAEYQREEPMDRVSRCLRCGKRTVPAPSLDGRTEFKCVFCDKLDPLKIEAAKWADSPLATPFIVPTEATS